MAKKRRTKKDKKEAKHNFKLSWEPGASKAKKGKSVKGQSSNRHKKKSSASKNRENAKSKAKPGTQAWIKKDIIKSLALAGFILSLEIVLYFIWPR